MNRSELRIVVWRWVRMIQPAAAVGADLPIDLASFVLLQACSRPEIIQGKSYETCDAMCSGPAPRLWTERVRIENELYDRRPTQGSGERKINRGCTDPRSGRPSGAARRAGKAGR